MSTSAHVEQRRSPYIDITHADQEATLNQVALGLDDNASNRSTVESTSEKNSDFDDFDDDSERGKSPDPYPGFAGKQVSIKN